MDIITLDMAATTIAPLGLHDETQARVLAALRPHIEAAVEVHPEVVAAIESGDVVECKRVRLRVAKLRTAAEAERKSLKDESLRTGRGIDAAAGIITQACGQMEAALQDIEQAEARRLAAERQAIQAARAAELAAYVAPAILATMDLASQPPDVWALTLTGARAAHAERQRQAEAESQAAALREAEREVERQRLDAERRRLDEERARLEADRRRVDAEQEAERERLAVERRRAEAEERERRAAEERRLEAERAAARRAAAAPDADKLAAFAAALEAVVIPLFADPALTARCRTAIGTLAGKLRATVSEMREEAAPW